jgi:putative FmdB family regulatory protein
VPTYDYICAACGHALEIMQPMSEAPKRKCPECGKLKLKRQIGMGAGILFKGSGFYQTDYRSDSYNEGQKAEKERAKPAAEKKTGAASKQDKQSGSDKGASSSGDKPSKSPDK